MTTIVTRAGKGSPLTFTEADANFTNLNTDKYESGDSPTFAQLTNTTGVNVGLTSAGGQVWGFGVTPAAWSGAIVPAYAIQYGDRSAVYQYSGVNYIGYNVKINSSYQEVAITASGTPAKLEVGAGDVAMKVASANPGAGSAITFTTIATAKGTDNWFQVDCGKIKFPAVQSASTDANVLDDYEEGTWTPTDGSGAGLSFVAYTGRYVKIGKIVHCQMNVLYPATADASQAYINGLPFTAVSAIPQAAITKGYDMASNPTSAMVVSNNARIQMFAGAGNATNANVSSKDLYFTFTYEASA